MSELLHDFSAADELGAPGERLLTLPMVKALVPKSTATIYRWIEAGRFPRGHKIGPNSVVWRQSEVSRFITENTSTPA